MLHRLTPEDISEYQRYRLQHLLRSARHDIPYWKRVEKHLTRKDTFDINKFERFPILTREILLKHGPELVTRNAGRYKLRAFVTSGSTGIPKKFFAKKVYFQKMMAAEEFYVNFCGVRDFRRYGYATGKPHLEDLVTYFPADADIATLQKLLDRVSSIGGTLYRLLSLAEKIESGKLRFKPKFLLSGSEYLTTVDRGHLERVFQCAIYNKYVCAEVGILGLECPERGGFHIDPAGCYVEIVDDEGRPVKNNVTGRIIITTLNNRIMPLIRFDIGDIGKWTTEICTCGLDTRRLFFEGREIQNIKLPDGSKFPAIALIHSINLKFANIVAKQQIIQESVNKILLKFIPGPSYRPFHDKEILDRVKYHFQTFPEFSIEVRQVPTLDSIRNGKHVVFESLIED